MRSNSTTLLASVFVAAVLPTYVHAFSVADPKPRDVFSANGEFVLTLDPHTEEQPVFASDDRTQPLWVVESGYGFQDFYLSDDGALVVEIHWMFVQIDDYGRTAVGIHRASGETSSFTYEQLCPEPLTTNEIQGPVGDFWRRWLWTSTRVENELTIHTVDGFVHRFDLQTGALVGTSNGESMPVSHSWYVRNLYWLLAGAAVSVASLIALKLWWRASTRASATIAASP